MRYTALLVAVSAVALVHLRAESPAADVRIRAIQANQPYTNIGPNDRVFPQIAAGGGWETIVVLLNLGPRVDFTLRFYDDYGQPVPYTFRTYPEMEVVTSPAIEGYLSPRGSFNFSLYDVGDTHVAWAVLSYDTAFARMGAYTILRQFGKDRPPAEAIVPLSSTHDSRFCMPFDNIQGFTSAMAIVNPSTSTSHATVVVYDLNGAEITRDYLTLPPGNHRAFAIPAQFPSTAGTLGTIYVESDTSMLAAMGLRFNPAGAFTTVPILNYDGMFR
jgi:hypothetical protein